jgi:hypothetical protein
MAVQSSNDELIKEINSVDYNHSFDGGLVHSRQYYEVVPAKTTFSNLGAPVEFDLSLSPADFINGQNSFIHFTVSTNHDNLAAASYGIGSGANWMKHIQIISKDGQVIDDLGNVNQYMALNDRYKRDADYFTKQGLLKGYGEGLGAIGNSYVVPLGDMIPLFAYDRLLPPHISNGMKIRITCAVPAEMVVDATTPAFTDWTVDITNVRMVFDVYTMDLSITKLLEKGNIEIEYSTYKHFEKHYESQSTAVTNRFSVAKSTKAFAISTISNTVGTAIFAQDLLAGSTLALNSYQWRVGNRWNPAQAVTTDREAFAHSLRTFDRLSGISSADITPTTFNSLYNIFTIDLSRSPPGKNASGGGTPINSMNELTLNIEHSNTADRVMSMFIVHTKRLIIKPTSIEDKMNGHSDKISILE